MIVSNNNKINLIPKRNFSSISWIYINNKNLRNYQLLADSEYMNLLKFMLLHKFNLWNNTGLGGGRLNFNIPKIILFKVVQEKKTV